MWSLKLIPLLAAVGAAMVAWHHATQFDRHSSERSPATNEHDVGWPLAIGSLVVAVASITVFQLAVLSSLGPR
jgi:hypothetical protein